MSQRFLENGKFKSPGHLSMMRKDRPATSNLRSPSARKAARSCTDFLHRLLTKTPSLCALASPSVVSDDEAEVKASSGVVAVTSEAREVAALHFAAANANAREALARAQARPVTIASRPSPPTPNPPLVWRPPPPLLRLGPPMVPSPPLQPVLSSTACLSPTASSAGAQYLTSSTLSEVVSSVFSSNSSSSSPSSSSSSSSPPLSHEVKQRTFDFTLRRWFAPANSDLPPHPPGGSTEAMVAWGQKLRGRGLCCMCAANPSSFTGCSECQKLGPFIRALHARAVDSFATGAALHTCDVCKHPTPAAGGLCGWHLRLPIFYYNNMRRMGVELPPVQEMLAGAVELATQLQALIDQHRREGRAYDPSSLTGYKF